MDDLATGYHIRLLLDTSDWKKRRLGGVRSKSMPSMFSQFVNSVCYIIAPAEKLSFLLARQIESVFRILFKVYCLDITKNWSNNFIFNVTHFSNPYFSEIGTFFQTNKKTFEP